MKRDGDQLSFLMLRNDHLHPVLSAFVRDGLNLSEGERLGTEVTDVSVVNLFGIFPLRLQIP